MAAYSTDRLSMLEITESICFSDEYRQEMAQKHAATMRCLAHSVHDWLTHTTVYSGNTYLFHCMRNTF